LISLKIFKLEPTRDTIAAEVITYLNSINACWWFRHDPLKKGIGISGLINGKFFAIEIKKASETRFLIKNYVRIKKCKLKTERDYCLYKQIEFIKRVIANGGYGFFANSTKTVQEEFIKNGLI
jgi:hypothetical protein